VRIQAKEVEYSFAAVQSLGFIADTETISLAGELHKLLGKYQDLVMLATWIKKLELTSGKHLLMKRTLLLDTKQQRKRALSRYQKLIDARLI
jgi:CHAD domain-containing protein